ncbi:MAG TPA: hypothetical protein VI039_02230 [Solirubrobacterales bacterium]
MRLRLYLATTAACTLAVLAAMLFAGVAASSAVCSNDAIREAQGSEVLALPACMALEQVSPSKKGNQLARKPGPISNDGTRLAFNSYASLDAELPNYFGIQGDVFLANREEGIWAISGANLPFGSGFGANPQFSFSPDLTNWLQVIGTSDGVTFAEERTDHSFTVLSPALVNFSGDGGPGFQGSSLDHSHVLFAPEGNNLRTGTFLPGDPQPAGIGEDSNLYLARLSSGGAPVLELANRDKDLKVWGGQCGARLGGIEAVNGNNLNLPNGNRNQGAISADGSRTYISTRPGQPATGNCTEANRKRIMVREETPDGPVIEELFTGSECDRVSPPCATADGDDAYQGASIDQTKVYFTTTRQLADSDLDGTGTGTGNTTLGSKSVSNVTAATGTGTFSSGQKTVAAVSPFTGTIALGQRITGEGIPAGTTIAKVGNGTLELSAAATASGSKAFSTGPQPFSVGQTVSGPNVSPGTKITAVNVAEQKISLSSSATATGVSSLTASGAPSCDIGAAIAGCDLYLYDADRPSGNRLVQVSAGDNTSATPGTGANLYNSISAISADGSRAYFVAQGKLTADQNPEGATAIAGQPNLYTWDAETEGTQFIGTLEGNDGGGLFASSELWGSNGTWNNGAYPVPIEGSDPATGGDGHILLFKANAPLTANDTDGSLRDLYRYDADADELVLISKPEAGASDGGEANPRFGSLIQNPPGTDYAQVGRPISEDGQTIEVITTGALLPADNNSAEDIYLWLDGQVYLVPGTTQAPAEPSNAPSLSADGSTIGFHTAARLLVSDGDTAQDVYVARAGGGVSLAEEVSECHLGDDFLDRCQKSSAEPSARTVDTVLIASEAPPPCPKSKVRSAAGRCIEKHRKPKHRKRQHGRKRASNKQGKKK